MPRRKMLANGFVKSYQARALNRAGYIAESCVLNASFVLPGKGGAKQLVTPTFERALNGTTVRQILGMAESMLIKEV